MINNSFKNILDKINIKIYLMIQEITAIVDEGPNLRCRFYANKYPKENDLVVVEVVEV